MTTTPTASTLHCYTDDWATFCAWCEPRGIDPLHCAVSDLTDCFREWSAAGLSFSTIGRRKAAIGYFQRQAGVAHPTVNDYALRAVMTDLRRSAPAPRGKLALRDADLKRIYQNCEADPRRLIGLRDRAIVAVMWTCCLKRAALAGLRVADLADKRRLPHLSDEARRMLLVWLREARIVEGPLFRNTVLRRLHGRGRPAAEVVGITALSSHSVAYVIKRRCAEIGKARARFSAGSVRNGRVAHEVRRGTTVRDIMCIARVRTIDTVVRAVR